MAESVGARFFRHVNVGDQKSCWEWTGRLNVGGYGAFTYDGKNVVASRFAWELYNRRPIPKGMLVLHSCDNRKCVSPYHIRIGTHKDNTLDAIIRERHRGGGNYRLTIEQVEEILRKHYFEGFSIRELGRLFSVNHVTILHIIHGRNWPDVVERWHKNNDERLAKHREKAEEREENNREKDTKIT